MFNQKFLRTFLILCAILAIGIAAYVNAFDSGYINTINEHGEGMEQYWLANSDNSCQAVATGIKEKALASTRIWEYADGYTDTPDRNGNLNWGSISLYVSRAPGTARKSKEFRGIDYLGHDAYKRFWFRSPREVSLHANSVVSPVVDSDSDVTINF